MQGPRFGGAFCRSGVGTAAPALSPARATGYPLQKGGRNGPMKKLRSHSVGIDSDDVMLFSDFEEGGEMWTGRGQRERRRRIRFSEKFKSPPSVQLSPSLWDVDGGTVIRADLTAEAITAGGFDMVFRTWGDTRFARMRISWMAIGEVSEFDDWDVE